MPKREMTNELEIAITAHQGGQINEAIAVYKKVLDVDPIHSTALHYLGIAFHQIGNHVDALENLILSTELEPENSSWHNDLGNVYFQLGRFAEAERCYLNSLEIQSGESAVLSNLGASQIQQEKTIEAIATFRKILERDPDYLPALHHLGNIFTAMGDLLQASLYQCQAYVIPPHNGKSKEMLAISFYFLGRLDEAAKTYNAWLEDEPDNPVAAHMLAACSQRNVPSRASSQYIEFHFDKYAETFENNLLNNLRYRGVELVGDGLKQIGIKGRALKTLDLGCGTGLCGQVLGAVSGELIGVDLSEKMLEKAAKTGRYSSLIKSEIGEYLAKATKSFDLICAADTWIYFGNLDFIFEQVRALLVTGGWFLFTVEKLIHEDQDSIHDFVLHPSGRYQHSEKYIVELLTRNGLSVNHATTEIIRFEAGKEVLGMRFLAKKCG